MTTLGPDSLPRPPLCPVDDTVEAPEAKGRHCRKLAHGILTTAEARLTEKAQGGTITLADVREVFARLLVPSSEQDNRFSSAEEHCRHLLWHRDDETNRKDPFRRLMVRPLEGLFDHRSEGISRHFLHNYFQFLEIMFADSLGEYEHRCRVVLQSLRVAHGKQLTWETFYADPHTARILSHALRRLITFIESPTGQWAWPHTISRPDPDGYAPSPAEAETVLAALRDTWRGLEFQVHPVGEAQAGVGR